MSYGIELNLGKFLELQLQNCLYLCTEINWAWGFQLLLVLLRSWSSWIGPVTAWQCWSCISSIRAFEGTVRLRWHSCIIFDVKSSAGNSMRNSSALTEKTKCWQRCGAAGTFIAGGNANWYNYCGKRFGNLE